MKSATQDRYWPDRLGSRTGGPVPPSTMVWKQIGSRLPSGHCQFWSVRSGEYPYFGLFGLANTHISVCSVWPIPKFWSVRSGQYPNFGLFDLANNHISVCSVWPIPIFRSVRSGQFPYFGLFGLANTHILVCSVWLIPVFRSVWSGQDQYFGLFGQSNTHILVWPERPDQKMGIGQTIQTLPRKVSISKLNDIFFGNLSSCINDASAARMVIFFKPSLLRSDRFLGLLKTSTIFKNELKSVHG